MQVTNSWVHRQLLKFCQLPIKKKLNFWSNFELKIRDYPKLEFQLCSRYTNLHDSARDSDAASALGLA
jgi:hypothetical protein